MKQIISNLLKFIIFLGIGLGILYYVYLRQDAAYQEDCVLKNIPPEQCDLIQKIIDDFSSANYFWVLLVLICFLISNLSRNARWLMLLKPLGYTPRFINGYCSIMIGYFANLFLPRIGEVVRAGTISRYEKMAPEKVMGTIVVDRLVDVMSMLVVFGLAFVCEAGTLWDYISKLRGGSETATEEGVVNLLVILAVAGLVFLFILFLFRNKLRRTKLYEKIINIIKGLWEGVQTIRQVEKPWLFVLHSINVWLMYYLMTYLCFFAFGPTAMLGLGAGLIIFVSGALGILIPSPGGLGTYHFLVTEALMIYGLNEADGFSFANILFFSVQIGCNVFLGLTAYLILPMLNRNYVPQHSANLLPER